MPGSRRTIADVVRQQQQWIGEQSRWWTSVSLPGNDADPQETETGASQAGLIQIADFGSNPGALRMLIHLPKDLPSEAPLVVALHGCTQRAVAFDRACGWSTLAARLGFALLLPEQRRANNPNRCFNWFTSSDTRRDAGETLSIRQMVDRMVACYALDPGRVYVEGLSAGGAMAAAVLAAYPELFAGGAVIGSVPYGAATNARQARPAMAGRLDRRPAGGWGDVVRAASPHRGPWPRVSIWHGDADPSVHPVNAERLAEQWTELHGLASKPTLEERDGAHLRRVWCGPDGEALVESHTIAGMAHGAPIRAGAGPDCCGVAGPATPTMMAMRRSSTQGTKPTVWICAIAMEADANTKATMSN